jgi:hypothetical protein
VTPGVQWSAKLPSSPSAGPIIPETNMTIESFLPGTLTYKENQQTTTCSSGSPVVNSTLSRFEYRAFDGTSHELRDTQTNGAIAHTGAICGQGAYTAYDRGRVFTSSDNSNLTFTSETDVTDQPGGWQAFSGLLVDKHGTSYHFNGKYMDWARDRNGNKVSFGYTLSYLNYLSSATDALNRSLSISSPPAGTGTQTVSYSGIGGVARTITITYDSLHNLVRDGSPVEEVKQLSRSRHGAATPSRMQTSLTRH